MAWSITDTELQPDSPITSSLMFRMRNGGIETGATTVFHQAAAPLGWTKLVDIDNRAIRIFSGAPSDGGSVDFSVAFGRTATDGHALTVAQLAPHAHNSNSGRVPSSFGEGYLSYGNDFSFGDAPATKSAGGGQAHGHDIDLRVRYIGMIRCRKD
jgi:hypothetical protein